MTQDTFYHEFEANFRGSRDEIRGRLDAGYSKFLEPLRTQMDGARALDLGCGRGEWLELAASFDFKAEGVDLDDGMLADCFALGLDVRKADAIEYLASLPSESLAIVSGFHIAEHLPFDVLRKLIGEAMRALRPGGLLILETPNAENISVGTLWFHMDPTHVRPLPPGFLSFLARNAGFARVDVLRLQEDKALRDSADVGLIDVLRGASPDYSIVAQKAGPAEIMAALDGAFGVTGGLTVETLSERFEKHLEGKVSGTLEARLQHWQNEIDQWRRTLEERQANQEALIADYQRQILDLRSSTSWKITQPLRDGMILAKSASRKIKATTRTAALRVLANPTLRKTAKAAIKPFPKLEALGKRFLIGGAGNALAQPTALHQDLSARHISPRAQKIYEQLSSRRSKS